MAKRITNDFGFEVLSTGDMIRAQIAAQTDIGQQFERIVAEGKLVPADVCARPICCALAWTHSPHSVHRLL